MRQGGSYRIEKKGQKPKLIERTRPVPDQAKPRSQSNPKTDGGK